ncbi:MAG: hypothetical protein IPI30_13615 [Saprospiraceae bacterium]|nr:hypothetical protein [Candidatus Vicinibacter affinis]
MKWSLTKCYNITSRKGFRMLLSSCLYFTAFLPRLAGTNVGVNSLAGNDGNRPTQLKNDQILHRSGSQ